MAVITNVAVDAARWPLLAGPTCTHANATTYASPAQPLVEAPFNQSHYMLIDCFDAANRLLGRASLDTGAETVAGAYRAGTLDGILDAAFGAPQPDPPGA